MVRSRVWLLLAAVASASGCGKASKRAPDPAPVARDGAPAKPALRLVVLLVVDQLPSWSFSRDLPHLKGGLARLAARGAYYPSAEFPYACTYTAPGHNALCTGASPAVTGVLANGWYERSEKAMVSAVEDRQSPVFWIVDKPKPENFSVGASGRRFLVEGVADVLASHTRGAAKSVSIGLKDRAAIPLLGRKPNLAIWYDEAQPAMTTSRWYVEQPPEWLRKLPAISARFDYVWEPSDPALLEEISGGPDDSPGEGASYGFGTTFPHRVADSKAPAEALVCTPAGTDLVLDTARAAIQGESLGADDVPDLLGITLSSHDYAGHDWGQESWERIDLFLALDRSVGAFLDYLDQTIGPDRYAIVVTSDHGAVPLVERSVSGGLSARRIPVADIIATANAAAEKILGKGSWVKEYAASTLYATDDLLARPELQREQVLDAIENAVRTIPGVGYARRTDQITGNCDQRNGLDALACRSILPGRSGEVFVTPDRYSITTTEWNTGSSHGTPSDEDRFVPIIVYAPGWPAGERKEPVSMLQVAPTIAALLGIPAPASAKASPLP